MKPDTHTPAGRVGTGTLFREVLPHACSVPGWWTRRRYRIRVGDRWRCQVCGDTHQLRSGFKAGKFWTRLRAADSNTPEDQRS